MLGGHYFYITYFIKLKLKLIVCICYTTQSCLILKTLHQTLHQIPIPF